MALSSSGYTLSISVLRFQKARCFCCRCRRRCCSVAGRSSASSHCSSPATPSHLSHCLSLLPPFLRSPSRTRAAVRGWRSVHASPRRAPAASATQKGGSSRSWALLKRTCVSSKRCRSLFFSPSLTLPLSFSLLLFSMIVVRFHQHDLVTVSHLTVFIDLLTSSAASSYTGKCVCVGWWGGGSVCKMSLGFEPNWNAKIPMSIDICISFYYYYF